MKLLTSAGIGRWKILLLLQSHGFIISFRLMVYPPPPAKGGISVTNEDLHCLNDGEFLNDVIIDFYLKLVWSALCFILKKHLHCAAVVIGNKSSQVAV